MNRLHVKTGDEVKIIAGKDKGKIGKIIQVFPKKGKVVVEGANIMKKHLKSKGKEKGQIIELSAPIHVSNVKIVTESEKIEQKKEKKNEDNQ